MGELFCFTSFNFALAWFVPRVGELFSVMLDGTLYILGLSPVWGSYSLALLTKLLKAKVCSPCGRVILKEIYGVYGQSICPTHGGVIPMILTLMLFTSGLSPARGVILVKGTESPHGGVIPFSRNNVPIIQFVSLTGKLFWC